MPALIYALSALSAVILAFSGFHFLLGPNSLRSAMLPATAFSATISAALAEILLSRYRPKLRFDTNLRTGTIQGMLVALCAHVQFGLFFVLWAVVMSSQGLTSSGPDIFSTLQEMVYTSAYSMLFLPLTLIISCVTGIILEHHS